MFTPVKDKNGKVIGTVKYDELRETNQYTALNDNGRIRDVATEEQAITMCHKYNITHKPGRLSRKAEFESI